MAKSDRSQIPNATQDRDRAVRFLVIKAAIFILIPLAAAVLTALWVLQ